MGVGFQNFQSAVVCAAQVNLHKTGEKRTQYKMLTKNTILIVLSVWQKTGRLTFLSTTENRNKRNQPWRSVDEDDAMWLYREHGD